LLTLSLAAFTVAFALVVLAEMGDKTQLVAMSFATRFNPYKVILAIFLATVANFTIVIVVGELLITIVPLGIISLAASISFIAFGIWTARDFNQVETAKENARTSRFGVVAEVGFTFFIAEFGDKTQLTTLSLAAQYNSPISVLIGATLAMLVADGLGIIIGVVLCKHIPQRIIKWFSAVIFVVFGLVGVYEVLNAKTGLLNTAFILLVLSIVSALAMLIFAKTKKPLTNDSDKRLCREKTIVKTYSLFLKI